MKSFTTLTVTFFGASVTLAQDGFTTTTFPSGSVPTAPPFPFPLLNNGSGLVELINAIPPCWQPCVGGAIKVLCPTDDSWTCACNINSNANLSTAPDITELTTTDAACSECNENIGQSDGGEQGMPCHSSCFSFFNHFGNQTLIYIVTNRHPRLTV
jgi:hypothetical protein